MRGRTRRDTTHVRRRHRLVEGTSGTDPFNYPAVILATPNLVSYWRLGEASGTVAADEKGVNDGTYVNTPTLGVTGALSGDPDTAVTFAKASTQYITFATATGFPTGSAARTVICWAKRAATDTTQLFRYGTRSGTTHFPLYWLTTGVLQVWNGTSTVDSAVTAASDGAWHMFAVSYNGSGVSFSVDGSAWETPQALTLTTDATNVTFAFDTAPTLDGSGDEISIYSRALTAAEVAAHYAAGR